MYRELRWAFLPYCLDRQDDGRYAILNRLYKPVGFNTSEWVDYSAYPVCVKVRGLGPATARKLSCHGHGDLDRIYLYNDGCVPTRSPDAMAAYLEKLQILASLRVEWPASRSHTATTKKLLVAGRPCREESLDSLRSALASAAGAD